MERQWVWRVGGDSWCSGVQARLQRRKRWKHDGEKVMRSQDGVSQRTWGDLGWKIVIRVGCLHLMLQRTSNWVTVRSSMLPWKQVACAWRRRGVSTVWNVATECLCAYTSAWVTTRLVSPFWLFWHFTLKRGLIIMGLGTVNLLAWLMKFVAKIVYLQTSLCFNFAG